MIRRAVRRLTLIFILFFLVLPRVASQEDTLAASAEILAVTTDRVALARTLADWAEERGGYYTYRSETEVHLRIPPRQVYAVRAFLETSEAEILRYNPSTADYRQQIADAEAAVIARTEALERVLRYLEGATISATLAFERELRSLNQEIEEYTGYLRRLRNDVRYARVRVVLSGYEETMPYLRQSSFAWINDLGMYSFLESVPGGGRYR